MKVVPTHRVPAVQRSRAFTLIELLVVIAVAGLLAALAVPAIKQFGRSNQQVAATRQMLDAVGRARQLAIANRTTVYMVFLPRGFLDSADPFYPGNPYDARLTRPEVDRVFELAPEQCRAYALLSLRTVGDQPGRHRPRYLSEWRTLPPGWVFATNKFIPRTDLIAFTNANTFGPADWLVRGFAVTNGLPFPTADSPSGLFFLPYIAFDHRGQLASGEDEYIPLARATVDPVINPDTGDFLPQPAIIEESPPDNSFTEYNLIHIDWLTGRARLETRRIE